MAKPKHKIKRTGPYAPIIAVITAYTFFDGMPIDYGHCVPIKKERSKTDTTGYARVRRPKGGFRKTNDVSSRNRREE